MKSYGLTPPENCTPIWMDAVSHENPQDAIDAELEEELMELLFSLSIQNPRGT